MQTTAPNETETDSTELARKAINHVLAQIRKNPDVRYHMGAMTESFELLKAAHSALNGISEEAIEAETFVQLSRKAAAQKLDSIREIADSCEGFATRESAAIKQIATLCRE